MTINGSNFGKIGNTQQNNQNQTPAVNGGNNRQQGIDENGRIVVRPQGGAQGNGTAHIPAAHNHQAPQANLENRQGALRDLQAGNGTNNNRRVSLVSQARPGKTHHHNDVNSDRGSIAPGQGRLRSRALSEGSRDESVQSHGSSRSSTDNMSVATNDSNSTAGSERTHDTGPGQGSIQSTEQSEGHRDESVQSHGTRTRSEPGVSARPQQNGRDALTSEDRIYMWQNGITPEEMLKLKFPD